MSTLHRRASLEVSEGQENLLDVHNLIRICRHYIAEFFRAEGSQGNPIRCALLDTYLSTLHRRVL
jgi:hypothetical protein